MAIKETNKEVKITISRRLLKKVEERCSDLHVSKSDYLSWLVINDLEENNYLNQ